jgi:hypothetical protein
VRKNRSGNVPNKRTRRRLEDAFIILLISCFYGRDRTPCRYLHHFVGCCDPENPVTSILKSGTIVRRPKAIKYERIAEIPANLMRLKPSWRPPQKFVLTQFPSSKEPLHLKIIKPRSKKKGVNLERIDPANDDSIMSPPPASARLKELRLDPEFQKPYSNGVPKPEFPARFPPGSLPTGTRPAPAGPAWFVINDGAVASFGAKPLHTLATKFRRTPS